MKLLITGGTGMLGKALRRFAVTTYDEVFTPARQELDLLDEDSTYRYIAALRPEVIIHAAARVGGISANIANPLSYLSENICMDVNLMTTARKLATPKLIYTASSCMYPSNLEHAMREEEILTGPLEPTNEGYALAKLVGWKMVKIIASESKLSWRTVILSNLYGPNDHFDPSRSHLLAAIVAKMMVAKANGKECVEMWGDGSSRREFTFVDDVAEFLIQSLPDLDKFPVTMNLGVGTDYSVREYYDYVAKVIGFTGSISEDLSKPTGMRRKLMDSSLARKLGWEPKTGIETGIRQTIEWYQSSERDASFE